MSPYKTPKFKTLQRKWYQKLKKSGFEDIEDTDSENEFMKTWHSTYFQTKYKAAAFVAKQEYFERASSFLHTHKFASPHEKEVWERHADGKSLRKIAAEMNKKVCQVHKIIKTLTVEMKQAC